MESRAYTQAYVMIDSLSDELKRKIPKEIITAIKSKMDSSYEFSVEDEEVENIELLEDTEKILSVIYTDYLATEEERKIIKDKERACFLKSEQEKKEKYSEHVFARKQTPAPVATTETETSKNWLIVPKERWYQKVINMIKKIFKKGE